MSDWNSDLRFGQLGEKWLCEQYPDKLEQLDGKGSDLRFIASWFGVQVKCDRRSHLQTGNMFIERYSHKERQTPGGPWKAAEDGSFYFAYLFWPTKHLVCYTVCDLLELLENPHYNFREVKVSGASNALGYLVPLEAAHHIQLDFGSLT